MNPIKRFKDEKGVTYLELCNLLGEESRYEKSLVNIANGKRLVPASKVIRWAAAMNIPGESLRPDLYPSMDVPAWHETEKGNIHA
ncbi:hypothetical protein [Serratia marcescens]|uniref:Helix-turn-helix domain-containing protein n=1 Tax=Serratia marcescens TaxID=615 RepID=A0ABD6HS53_SERMA|nr:hypothetical protein [Serratia marcescens]MVF05170.1 hypothetical protein [Serratia marcescens]